MPRQKIKLKSKGGRPPGSVSGKAAYERLVIETRTVTRSFQIARIETGFLKKFRTDKQNRLIEGHTNNGVRILEIVRALCGRSKNGYAKSIAAQRKNTVTVDSVKRVNRRTRQELKKTDEGQPSDHARFYAYSFCPLLKENQFTEIGLYVPGGQHGKKEKDKQTKGKKASKAK